MTQLQEDKQGTKEDFRGTEADSPPRIHEDDARRAREVEAERAAHHRHQQNREARRGTELHLGEQWKHNQRELLNGTMAL